MKQTSTRGNRLLSDRGFATFVVGSLFFGGLSWVAGSPATAAIKTAKLKVAPVETIRLQEAVKQTTESSTMTFGVSINMDMSISGKAVNGTITGFGVSDRLNKSTAFTMDMGSFIKSLAVGSGEPIPARFNDPAIFKMKVISIGTKAYLNYPLINSVGGSPQAKPWILIDTTKLGLDASYVAASQGADPNQGLNMLAGLSSATSNLGPDTIDGLPATKYAAALSVESLKKNLSPAQARDVSKLMSGSPTLPVSIWIDQQNRVRRIDATFAIDQSGARITMKSSYTFSKFNEPVTVSAPPESEVDTTSPIIETIIASATAKKSL